MLLNELERPLDLATAEPGLPTGLEAFEFDADDSALCASPLRRLQEIETLVGSLVATWQSSQGAVQCRRWHRVPCQRPLVMQPVDHQTGAFIDAPLLVDGRDISVGGISFTHRHPLPYRQVAIIFDTGEGGFEAIITRLSWCRFTRQGDYRSGGQFLRRVRLSAEHSIDAANLRSA